MTGRLTPLQRADTIVKAGRRLRCLVVPAVLFPFFIPANAAPSWQKKCGAITLEKGTVIN